MKKTTKKDYLLYGMIIYSAGYSLYQDLVYKTAEGMIKHVENSWTDRSITIPIALILLVLTVSIIVIDRLTGD